MSSSIHIKRATSGAVTHNSRENFSHSVVFPNEKNELWNKSKEAYSIYREELKIRTENYTNRTGKKLHSKAITHLSAVVNLNQHHTLKDLKPLAEHIQNLFDTKVFQISIHRDEGKLVDKKDGSMYTSGIDFFKSPQNDKLYWDKKYTKEIDLSQFKIEKNYHAHIEFMGLDSTGGGIKRNYMNKYKLSELQTFTAKVLGMERGKNYVETKEVAPKRLDVLEFKKQNKASRELVLSKVQDVKKQYQEERKELIASKSATQEDYARLKKSYEELEEKARLKQLTIEELQARKNNLSDALKAILPTAQKSEEVVEYVQELKAENKELKEATASVEDKVEKLELKITNLQEWKTATLNNQQKINEKVQNLIPDYKEFEPQKGFFPNILDTFKYLKEQLEKALQQIKELKESQELTRKVNKVLEGEIKTLKNELEWTKKFEPTQSITNEVKIVSASNLDRLADLKTKMLSKEELEKAFKSEFDKPKPKVQER